MTSHLGKEYYQHRCLHQDVKKYFFRLLNSEINGLWLTATKRVIQKKKKKKKKDQSFAGYHNANQTQMTPDRVYTQVKHFADTDVDTKKCQSAV